MNLSSRIAPHITPLRRFSRELTGDQTNGDAYVAVLLESIIANPAKFDGAEDVRVALYQRFCQMWESIPLKARMPRCDTDCGAMSAKAREAFLLAQIEGFALHQISQILSCDPDCVASMIDEASHAFADQFNQDTASIADGVRTGCDHTAGFERPQFRPHCAIGAPGTNTGFKHASPADAGKKPARAARLNWLAATDEN